MAGTVNNHGGFVWSIAEVLRGDYKQSEYQKVILPLVVIRRLDAVLEPTKDAVLAGYKKYRNKVDNLDPILEKVSCEQFYNISPLTFRKLLDDPGTIADNLRTYLAGFSTSAHDVIDKFEFDTQITRLDKADLLYMVVSKFAELDLHPDRVSNEEMGYLYEDLIRKFSELSNETAGEHFTPREVIELMVNLLFIEDDDMLAKPGLVRQRGLVSSDCTVLRLVPEPDPNFAHNVLRSSWFVGEMTYRLRGIGTPEQGNVRTPRVRFGDLSEIPFPVPPIEAQRIEEEILAHVVGPTRGLINAMTTQLSLLAEYREAVITAAVTGEIDVESDDSDRYMEKATT